MRSGGKCICKTRGAVALCNLENAKEAVVKLLLLWKFQRVANAPDGETNELLGTH